jgi:hypothetical protein
MWFQHRATMPTNPIRGKRASPAYPLHQLHGSRGTDLVTGGSLTDRAALLNSPGNPPAKIL